MKSTKRNFLTRFTNWGVTPDLPPVLTKRIILTNQLGLLFGLYMLLSAIWFMYLELYFLTALATFFVLTEFSWPLFNLYGRYQISRVGMLISSNFLGFFTSVLLPNTGYNRGFFVMVGLPILLFGLKEKRFIFLGFVMLIALYPLSEWVQHLTPIIMLNRIELNPLSKDIIYFATGTFYLTLVFLMFYFLSNENAKAEERLENALLKLEDQKARAFSSAKFAALGEMAGGIAHEINNPMMSIQLTVEQIKRSLIKPEYGKEIMTKKLDSILSIVQRVAKIITAMRTFSRDASNESFRKVSLVKIIEDTLTLCSENFKKHNIEMILNYPTEGFEINCREVQISQVILNLLNNAFDAIVLLPEKWIKFDVVKDNVHDKVIISISDSGKGIPNEINEKIFQPFFTTKEIGKGTGLGLSLSRKIIENHGGSLYLNTAASTTQFIIELPGAKNELALSKRANSH